MKKKKNSIKFSKNSVSYIDVMKIMMKNIEEMITVMNRTLVALEILDKRLKRLEGLYARKRRDE